MYLVCTACMTLSAMLNTKPHFPCVPLASADLPVLIKQDSVVDPRVVELFGCVFS
jgi:hypothetical protein